MQILFLGDSITDCGHCFTDDNLGNGYVKYIAHALPGCTVINGGTDGFTFPRIYNKWKSMYKGNSYDAVVILGGINDVAVMSGTGLDEIGAARCLETSKIALMSLVQEVISDGAKQVIVIEPFLFEAFGWTAGWKPGLDLMRSMIRTVVRDQTALLRFPEDQVSLSTDGVHLTDTGHRLLAELLLGHFQNTL